ncbi:hypothetical protein Pryu01_03002 [Paraliobacillus ryukyuensis]|uniref:Minor capsid protein n=1 Tax=Paraliobacillus ryukyuensis TaxID=200904 RepID=A0A366DPQ9_9BACI|nr:putative minor capsid protein [Paraliobacillus ryukyuensis]RBO92066.1 minor capsid protein [Paraliobacillus ryukyuensis]
MPTIKPIPKKVLVHEVIYISSQPEEGDGWNDGRSEPKTISNVRVEPTTSMNRSSDSQGVQANHVLFIDRVNSSLFPSVKAGDKFIFNDVEREASSVKGISTFSDEFHHLEIELV